MTLNDTMILGMFFLMLSPSGCIAFFLSVLLLCLWRYYRRHSVLVKTRHRLPYHDLCRADSRFSGECSICLEMPEPKERVSVVSCGCRQAYHDHCLSDWLRRSLTCPNCRRDLAVYQS